MFPTLGPIFVKKSRYDCATMCTKNATNPTRIIRNWYAASDDSGINAVDRIKYLLEIRNLLLGGVDFSVFPPVGKYMKGVPIITYEGILMDIESKLHMFAILGPIEHSFSWKHCS